MQEMDRRTRRTRKAINEAFWKLMQEKSFEDITIQDITDAADIHRATFYLHYQDKYDWQEQNIMLLVQEFAQEKEKLLISGEYYTLESFKDSFRYYDQNYERYAILLQNKGSHFFHEYYREKLIDIFKKHQKPNGRTEAERDFVLNFCISAVVGTIEWWFRNDRPLSADEMADKMYILCQSLPEWVKP